MFLLLFLVHNFLVFNLSLFFSYLDLLALLESQKYLTEMVDEKFTAFGKDVSPMFTTHLRKMYNDLQAPIESIEAILYYNSAANPFLSFVHIDLLSTEPIKVWTETPAMDDASPNAPFIISEAALTGIHIHP